MCNGQEVVEVIFFAGSEPEVLAPPSPIDRQNPSDADLSNMKYRSVSELLGFNSETIKNLCVFSDNPVLPSILNVIHDDETISTILTHGKHWRLTDWSNNRQICIQFTPDGYITHESAGMIGTWSIKKEGSFALYQDKRDWTTIYRQKIRRRVCLEMIGGRTYNMYVLNDTTSGIFYLNEELAYFQILNGKVTMADISGRSACEAVRVV